MTTQRSINNISHKNQKRKNLPSAEQQPIVHPNIKKPVQIAYERRNRDLDPQLVWRGKEAQDQSDLYIEAPPLYIQERIHPKALIQDLIKQSQASDNDSDNASQPDLFADFNGLPDENAKTEFYQHDANWSNRMILGDSLQVMASLAEREGMRNKVQCIYIDPPYGIRFNSNFQWSTTSRDVRDGNANHITREPEQVKAFRDTWRDGIHSYLSYLRDRLTVARDLLTDSSSIFVQIGDENVHRVRALMDEVFGDDNFVSLITFTKTSPLGTKLIPNRCDYIVWFAKDKTQCKYRSLFLPKGVGEGSAYRYAELSDGTKRSMTREEQQRPSLLPKGATPFVLGNLLSAGYGESCYYDFQFEGRVVKQGRYSWKTTREGMKSLMVANRVYGSGARPGYVQKHSDFPVKSLDHLWNDMGGANDRRYVVETNTKAIQRCILMTTDPGDIVLDPTCGGGTTAYVSEQWGRRWMTIDTSRVALAIARARIMGARYPYYLLTDSREGQLKEAQISRTKPADTNTANDIRQGFVYERVPHITLRHIAHNSEIDVIYEEFQAKLEPLRLKLNHLLNTDWEEWQIPRKTEDNGDYKWSDEAIRTHVQWWKLRTQRQKEIDASIAANAEYEYLYDKPYEDRKKVRVAGPFTVESIAPHRMLAIDEDDNIIDKVADNAGSYGYDFATVILENLRKSGVQQTQKQDKINFTSITNWPGNMICADARYSENNHSHSQSDDTNQDDSEHDYSYADEDSSTEKRAAIFIGPEFGTMQRADIIQAAREAAEAQFDILVTCAFNYEAHTTELDNYGYMPVLKARMNADLHMAADLKPTQAANLFVIFGEPDIEIQEVHIEDPQHPDHHRYIDNQNQPQTDETDETEYIRIKVKGVDVFHPGTGQIRSDGTDGIACWFIDTDYNEEQFFVRHAYFLGASNDPYKSLKTTLKAQINRETWDTIKSDVSRPFPVPASRRIAIKIINHLGDETIKTFKT